MFLNVRNNRIITVLLASFFALFVCCLTPRAVRVYAAVTNEEIAAFYKENKDLPELLVIDEGAEVFTEFFEQSPSDPETFYRKMCDEVDVVNYFKNLKNEYVETDYSPGDYRNISNRITELENGVRDVFNANFDKTAIIGKIDALKNRLDADYKTLAEKFDESKTAGKSEITSAYELLLQPNNSNPDGAPNTVVGYMDETALAEAKDLYEQAIKKIDETVYSSSGESSVKETAKKVASDFRLIPKNNLERAYNSVMDYRAVTEGGVESGISVEQIKKTADDACAVIMTEFVEGASEAVIKRYSAEISQIDKYLKGDFTEYEGDFSKKDTLSTADGTITICAYKRSEKSQEPYKAFPHNAKISLYKSANGAGKRNASKAITAKNADLEVGYFIYLDVYVGSKEWGPTLETEDGAEVVYRVSVDLNKYYDNYVVKYDGLIENALSGVPFFRSKITGTNKLDAISAVYGELSENNDVKNYDLLSSKDKSVVYSYYREDGHGAISALDFDLDTKGGILMFDTTKFGTFATAQFLADSLFANPVFWVIVAVALIAAVVVLIIILKNIKYKFKFITNGGTPVKPVKARLGESFPLPDPPTREGYVFGGWYLDEQLTVRFVDSRVNKRKGKKVYAKWYESEIPEKYVKYFEKLRNEMLCYSKVGPIANMGLEEKEVLAKLFADKDGVNLYLALSAKSLRNKGFDVEDARDEFEVTPAKKIVDGKESFKEAIKLIGVLMTKKGLQNVGPATLEEEPMTLEERQNGFEFAIENDRVAVSLSDYFEYLRYYTKSFVLYKPASNLNDGDMLVRMYLTDECIDIYMALSPSGALMSASEKFEDTPALFKCTDSLEDINKACNFIDRVMSANGYEKRNESVNDFKLQKAKKGCGFGFKVTLD